MRDQRLEQVEPDGSQDDGIDRLRPERAAEDEEGRDQQDGIDGKIGITDLDRTSGRILDDGGDTGHAAADQVVGHEENRPPQHEQEDAEGDQEVLLEEDQDLFGIKRHLFLLSGFS